MLESYTVHISAAKIATVFFLLCILAFASSSETAFFSLNRFQLRRIRERAKPAYNRIRRLLARPTRLLLMILLMSEIVNLALSTLVTQHLEHLLKGRYAPEHEWYAIALLSMALTLPIILLVGEITPKVIAAKMNRVVAVVNSSALIWIYKVLFPVLWLLDAAIGTVLRKFKAEGRDHLSKTMQVLTEDDFVLLMEEGHREGTVDPAERKLIKNVFEFDDSLASEVMTPIAQAFCISASARLGEVLPEIRAQKFSRIPVFQKTRRNIVGMLYVKDLLPLRGSARFQDAEVRSVMTPILYVGPNMRLSLLFRRLKEAKTHMAIVVSADSAGKIGPSGVESSSERHNARSEEAIGIVTMEDALESIFGEIADERDVQ